MLLYLIAKLAVLRNGFEGRELFGLFRREAKLSLRRGVIPVKRRNSSTVTPPRGAGDVLRKALRFQRKPAVSRPALQNTTSRTSIQDCAWLQQYRLGRNPKFEEGSRIGIGQSQFSAKFLGALFHATNANANALRAQICNPLVDSLAIVQYGHHYQPILLIQGNPHLLSSRMPEHICERLLNNSEDRRLDFRHKPGEIGRLDIEKRCDTTPLCEPFHVPGKG